MWRSEPSLFTHNLTEAVIHWQIKYEEVERPTWQTRAWEHAASLMYQQIPPWISEAGKAWNEYSYYWSVATCWCVCFLGVDSNSRPTSAFILIYVLYVKIKYLYRKHWCLWLINENLASCLIQWGLHISPVSLSTPVVLVDLTDAKHHMLKSLNLSSHMRLLSAEAAPEERFLLQLIMD